MKLLTRIRLALNIINGSKFNLVDGIVLFDALKKDQPGLFAHYDATTYFLDTLNKQVFPALKAEPDPVAAKASSPMQTARIESDFTKPSAHIEHVKKALHPHQLRALNGGIVTADNKAGFTVTITNSSVSKKDAHCLSIALKREFQRIGYHGNVGVIHNIGAKHGDLKEAIGIIVDSLPNEFTARNVFDALPDLGIVTTYGSVTDGTIRLCKDRGYKRLGGGVYSKT